MWEVEGQLGADNQLRHFSDAEVVELFREGTIDGLASVRRIDDEAGWRPLGETDLRALLAAEDDDAEEDEEALEGLQALIVQKQAQPVVTSTSSGDTAPPTAPEAKRVGHGAQNPAAAGGKGVAAKKKRTRGGQNGNREPRKNTAVYVSGLPNPLDPELFERHMKRVGVLKVHPETIKPHIKYYSKEDGTPSGDALVVYAKPESAELAVRYLDESWLDDTVQIHVELAKFDQQKHQQSGEKSPPQAEDSAVAREAAKKRRIAARNEELRQMSWAEDTPSFAQTKGSAKILLLRPCFTEEHTKLYPTTSQFYNFVATAISQQLDKMQVITRKVLAIARHPQGVVCLKFKRTEDADALLNRLRIEDVDLSPLRLYPGYENKPSNIGFYDGITDLLAQTVTDDEDAFTNPYDLDAIDRLWLQAAGVPPQMMLPPDMSTTPTVTAGSGGLGPAAVASAPTEETHQVDYSAKLEHFGDWLEAQSSDEEFAVQAEGGDKSDSD